MRAGRWGVGALEMWHEAEQGDAGVARRGFAKLGLTRRMSDSSSSSGARRSFSTKVLSRMESHSLWTQPLYADRGGAVVIYCCGAWVDIGETQKKGLRKESEDDGRVSP